MQEADDGSSPAVICSFPVACHIKTKYIEAMQRLQAFKYELMPDGQQQRQMARFAGACRFVFNKALALQQANHQAGGKFIGYVTMAKHLTAWRNSSLQGAYLILAARALGLDCGPMSGFDADKVTAEFFPGTRIRANFMCNIGYGNRASLRPRNPRLPFDEACRIL